MFTPTPSFGFSLISLVCWGCSDFLGGYASRKANSFLIAIIGHGGGLVLVTAIALIHHSPFPSDAKVLWAIAGGASGGAALGVFYRALSTGKMGLMAPVAAVLGAALPAVANVFLQGPPAKWQLAGFLLAGAGIWLISRTEDDQSTQGIGMAVIAGIGFAGFYFFTGMAGDSSALWTAATSRLTAFAVTALIVVLGKNFGPLPRINITWALFAGCLDVMGTVLFVRAKQTGRLDVAVVLTSLYPVLTVSLARLVLKEQFTRWKVAGMVAALASVPLIAS